MTTQLSQIKWGRITISAFSVYVFSFLTMMGIILGYATYLGFQAQGMPDPDQIAQFANQYASLLGSYGLILFTFLAALRMSRKIEAAPHIHGIALGVSVSALNLAISRLVSLDILISLILTIGAGWLGGKLGNRK